MKKHVPIDPRTIVRGKNFRMNQGTQERKRCVRMLAKDMMKHGQFSDIVVELRADGTMHLMNGFRRLDAALIIVAKYVNDFQILCEVHTQAENVARMNVVQRKPITDDDIRQRKPLTDDDIRVLVSHLRGLGKTEKEIAALTQITTGTLRRKYPKG